MIEIFGPNTLRVVRFIAQILDLGPEDIDTVATAWRHTPAEERAAAWTAIQHARSPDDRNAIRNAAAVARQLALTTALTHERHDWAFWSAAADAAGALAADGRHTNDQAYRVLVSAMATSVEWLRLEAPDPAVSTRTPLRAQSYG